MQEGGRLGGIACRRSVFQALSLTADSPAFQPHIPMSLSPWAPSTPQAARPDPGRLDSPAKLHRMMVYQSADPCKLPPCWAASAVSISWPESHLMFDQVEKLKREYTDKYVLVNENVPELARFGGHVGQVKTVNMNGRALVQFDTWNNIGWYDIELDALRVVPKPDPAATEAKKHDAKKDAPRPATKPAATTGAAPAAGEKKLSPLEMARMQGAAKAGGAAPAAAGGAKKSTADILAAARAKGSAPAADKPAAAKPAPAKPAAAPAAGGKLSTADILAAARAKKAAEAAPAATEQADEAETVTAVPMASKPAKAASKTTFTPGQRPSVPEILAWCREHDTK